MTIEFTQSQKAAIDAVSQWYTGDTVRKPVFRLFGFAGSGKSSIAKAIVEHIGAKPLYAAFTGKAASVLDKKGCSPAATVHSSIYIPVEKSIERLQMMRMELEELPKGTPAHRDLERKIQAEEEKVKTPGFVRNPDGPLANADIMVLDECSMINKDLAEDILSFNVPILSLGDPAQLPPVGGNGYFIDGKPDVMLTEIHRQAAGNPIIKLATEIRKGGVLRDPLDWGDVKVVARPKVKKQGLTVPGYSKEVLFAADQIICGKNDTRHRINFLMRKLKGFTDPQFMKGERVICLANNHDIGVLNGQIFEMVSNPVVKGRGPHFKADFRLEGTDEVRTLTVWGNRGKLKPEEFRLAHMRQMMIADWGYAITCHKSQGSEWPSVCVIDESRVFRQDASKWLYTSVSRATEKLTVCIT